MGSLSLLQQIFLTQKLNRGLLHCRRILYQLSYQGSPLDIMEGKKDSSWGHNTFLKQLASFLVELKDPGPSAVHTLPLSLTAWVIDLWAGY